MHEDNFGLSEKYTVHLAQHIPTLLSTLLFQYVDKIKLEEYGLNRHHDHKNKRLKLTFHGYMCKFIVSS